MTTYNTGNPVPSVDVRDLYDNAENLDNLVNGPASAYPDRLGASRKSWRGFESDFNAFLASSGFELPALEYVDSTPLVVDRPTQLIFRSGFPETLYGVKSTETFPVTLTGTWATDEEKLVVRSDGDLRQDLANATDPAKGAGQVGFLQAGTSAVGRSVQSKLRDVVSVKDFGAIGDGVTDDTAAIQAAVNSGAKTIYYFSDTYRVDGQIALASNQKHVGRGATFIRVVANNSQNFFYGSSVSNVEFEGLKIIGNVDRLGPGYLSSASTIYLLNSNEITLRNMNLSGGASGLQAYACTGLYIHGGLYTNNILSAVSGVANFVVVDGLTAYNNGYSSAGQTHDIYFLNSSFGRISNCKIGPNIDTVADSLVIRYDESVAATYPAFEEVNDWYIYDNQMRYNGMKFGSDPGVAVANRKPPKDISVANNEFFGNAGLWFDDPQNCESWQNKNISVITCRVASSYPGYVVGYVSDGDECNSVTQAALTAVRLVARDNVVFKGTTINNGASTAFNNAASFGGNPACTIIEPRIMGTGLPFDTAFLARYQTNLEVPVKASLSMRHLNRQALTETAVAAAGSFIPANHTSSEQIFFARLNGATATISPPEVAASGMILRLLLRQASTGAVTITFDPVYKLSSGTSAVLNTNANGNRMYLEFIYETGAWRQMGSATWAAV